MIESIRHKGLKLLWQKDNESKLLPAHVPKIRMILTLLDAANEVEDMNFPGSDLHPLKGDMKGYWSVKVSGNFRIIFRFVNGDVFDLNYVDYH